MKAKVKLTYLDYIKLISNIFLLVFFFKYQSGYYYVPVRYFPVSVKGDHHNQFVITRV